MLEWGKCWEGAGKEVGRSGEEVEKGWGRAGAVCVCGCFLGRNGVRCDTVSIGWKNIFDCMEFFLYLCIWITIYNILWEKEGYCM